MNNFKHKRYYVVLILFITIFICGSFLSGYKSSAKSYTTTTKKLTIYTNQTKSIKVDTKSKVTYKSSNKSVATVSTKGTITAKKKGSATITATYSNKKVIYKVTVKNPYINATKKTIYKGKTYTLKVYGVSQSKIKWTTSNKKIATVSSKGTVKGINKGTATITATVGKTKYRCKITITNPPPKISKSSTSLYVGKTTQLKVLYTTSKIKWSTSNKKIATVSSKGTVKGIKNGTATITATIGKKKYVCKVTVKNPMKLNVSTSRIYKGKTTQVKVYNASSTVKWTTSNKSIATVSSKGVVKGIKNGTATITATIGKTKLTCKITVSEYTTPKLSKTSVSLIGGETIKLTVSNATSTVTWSSNSENLSVSSNGLVTTFAGKNCSGTITAKIGTKILTCKIYVYNPSINHNAMSLTLGTKGKVTLSGTGTLSYQWTSSNTTVAIVDQSGNITPKKAGTTTIQTKVLNKTYSCTVSVSTPYITQTSVINLLKGKSTTLYVYDTKETIQWSSSNSNIVSVNPYGLITALSYGEVTISAKTPSGYAFTYNINATNIALNKTEVYMSYGSTGNTTVYATKEILKLEGWNGEPVSWHSSDPQMLEIYTQYNIPYMCYVEPLKAGTATVTATVNNKTYTCTFSAETISQEKEYYVAIAGQSYTINLPTKTPVTWSSEDESIAKVDNKGTVFTPSAIENYYASTHLEAQVSNVSFNYTIAVIRPLLSQTSMLIDKNKTATIYIMKNEHLPVTWSSSNTAIASVDAKGNITTKAYGTVKITATVSSDFGKKDYVCTVTVSSSAYKEKQEYYDFVDEINQYRKEDGLKPLILDTYSNFYLAMIKNIECDTTLYNLQDFKMEFDSYTYYYYKGRDNAYTFYKRCSSLSNPNIRYIVLRPKNVVPDSYQTINIYTY